VDVKTARHLKWTGPHKLLVYKLESARTRSMPAAYIKIELRELERWLIAGDHQIIRKDLPEERGCG
jgi:hypothetical protein